MTAQHPVHGAVDFYVCDSCGHHYMDDGVTCDCFDGEKPTCELRHVRMVPEQPAAAQEAVAWVDIANWRDGLPADECFFSDYQDEDTIPLYAAPVTAAPAMLNLANGVQLPLVADEAGYRIDPAYAQESTPAAPGIDLTPFREPVEYFRDAFAAQSLGPDSWHAVKVAEANRLLALIDASPKGDEAAPLHAHYCNAQPASAECICGLNSPKGGSEAPAVENVAEDTYHAIAEVLRTEDGWSVLEHVEYCRELILEARVALGRDGANADTNHRHRGLWVKLGRCLEGFAPGSDEALSELPKCDCENPCPATGAALISMTCPVHNDLPAAQASDAEVRP